MFKKTGRKSSSDSDDDNISLTSTVEDQHDSDEEFAVDGILADMETVQGTYYLVMWTGFGLHQATWEPEKQLGAEIKETWEETKRKQEVGEEQPFDVSLYEEALAKAKEEKMDRHRRRNRKRIRLGLPPTKPLLAEEDSSDDEAAEEGCLRDILPDPVPVSKSQTKAKINSTTKALPKLKTQPVKTSPVPSPTESSRGHVEARAASAAKSANKISLVSPMLNSPVLSPRESRPAVARSFSAAGVHQGAPARRASKNLPSKTSTADPVPRPTQTGSGARVGLKAKKTTASRKPSVNIFTGGKVRKQRVGIKDTMVDENRPARHFSSHHIRRIAELSARAKDDRPPDPDTLDLFDPSQARNRTLSSGSGPKETPPVSPVASKPSSREASIQTAAVTLSTSGSYPKPAVKSRSSTGGSTIKKQKTVRFLSPEGDERTFVSEPEPMDIDMADGGSSTSRPRLQSPPAPGQARQFPQLMKKATFSEYSAMKSQNVERTIVVGKGNPCEVLFNGLPIDATSEWLVDFMTETMFEFQYSCLAHDFEVQLQTGAFVQSRLSVGTVTPRNNSCLEELAVYLRSGLLGLYLARPQYNLIVYPTKCEEWKVDFLGQEPTSPSDIPLRFFLFSTVQNFTGFLRPLPHSLAAAEEKPVLQAPRVTMSKLVFDFDYAKLLPAQRHRNPRTSQAFFLAFPESRAAVMYSLCGWLRENDAGCQILSAHEFGSWQAYQNVTRHSAGVVIVHEFLVSTLRRFPGLSKSLLLKGDEYWCFSDALQPRSLFPSMTTEPLQAVPPGVIRWTRLFPARTAIFLTPSFLVSQPSQVRDFLDWYLAYRIKDTTFCLVTAWNFHSYLFDLATEKFRVRQALTSTTNAGAGKVDVEIEAGQRGLGHLDCEARLVAAIKAFELFGRREAKAGPFDADEENGPLVFADQSIDPNDEQSLVNWFGWWSTLRLDQFRHFHVIGCSEPAAKYRVNMRAELRVRIPEYTRATINDPDVVLEAVQANLDDSVREKNAGIVGPSAVLTTPGQMAAQKFHSKFASSDSKEDISRALGNHVINSRKKKASLWTLYLYPVSWADFAMSDHFEGLRASCKRFKDWFDFTWSFREQYSTYIGLFYTITEKWDPGAFPRGKLPHRQPWVVIYRPTTPYTRPYKETELIIWDPSAAARFGDAPKIHESQLWDMQRRVIKFIREEGPVKNKNTFLERVWLGGFERSVDGNHESPFDRTILYLQFLLEDIKVALPPFVNFSLVHIKDYRPVVLETDSVGQPAESSESHDVVMENSSDIDEDDNDKGKYIIFHPPRGVVLPNGLRTKCSNKLYEDARLARAQGKRDIMDFYFRPTMEWYREQLGEGRGFEHINVDSWEVIFKQLGVGGGSSERPFASSSVSEHKDSPAAG